jgi:hypothetical protein
VRWRRNVAQGLKEEGDPDLEVLRAFLLRPIPKPPAKPFAAEKASADGTPAAEAPKGNEVKVTVKLAKTAFRKGDPIEMTVTTARTGYVYCYVQSPATGKIQRIFPNRFARDPRVEANTPLLLPGAQGFKVAAGGDGVRQQAVGCGHRARGLQRAAAAAARWGDFSDIRPAPSTTSATRSAQVATARWRWMRH